MSTHPTSFGGSRYMYSSVHVRRKFQIASFLSDHSKILSYIFTQNFFLNIKARQATAPSLGIPYPARASLPRCNGFFYRKALWAPRYCKVHRSNPIPRAGITTRVKKNVTTKLLCCTPAPSRCSCRWERKGRGYYTEQGEEWRT